MASARPYASLHLNPDKTPTSHHSVFYRPDALPAAQPTVSKHWRKLKHYTVKANQVYMSVGCASSTMSHRLQLSLFWYKVWLQFVFDVMQRGRLTLRVQVAFLQCLNARFLVLALGTRLYTTITLQYQLSCKQHRAVCNQPHHYTSLGSHSVTCNTAEVTLRPLPFAFSALTL